MINQPNPTNSFAHHGIVNTLIDTATGHLDITVGSWPAEDTGSSSPSVIRVIRVKYDAWQPEYYHQIEQTVNDHPEWNGLPPSKPNNYCYFKLPERKWEDPRTLQDIKNAQWAQIKQARSQAEYAGFTWGGSTFDSDATSQNRITGAVTLAQLSPAFTIDWTLQDNTVRTLNAQEMCAVGAALGVHVQTQFAKGQALRAQIDAATTQAEVEAVVW